MNDDAGFVSFVTITYMNELLTGFSFGSIVRNGPTARRFVMKLPRDLAVNGE